MTLEQKIRKLYTISDGESWGFDEADIQKAEEALGIRLPAVLRDYYLTLGRHENVNYVNNRLLTPDGELGGSPDGYLVFYEENQVVVYWGIREDDLALPNPPVYANFTPSDPDPEWHMESAETEGFLLQMAIYNGCLGGLQFIASGMDDVSPEVVTYLAQHWEEIKGLSLASQRFFTNGFDDVITLSFDQEGECSGIFVGTNHRDRFDNILDTLNVVWTYTSDDDLDEDDADDDAEEDHDEDEVR